MKRSKRLIAIVVVSAILLTLAAAAIPINAVSDNSVSMTLYNDTNIPEGTSYPPAYTDAYTWEKSENTSDIFRLVINMDLNKKYSAGDIELIIDAFCPGSRNELIKRASIGGGAGVFKEVSEETINSGIKVTNTEPINGSANLSVTYQIKPHELKDLGSLNTPLTLKCTLTAGGETVTSNKISFTTDFTQSWSIINSGEHEDVYDEIEIYEINNTAPLNYSDRLLTIDNIIINPTTVEDSDYYWVEYRVPLLSDDPLGLYRHYIEIGLPDGCALYSAQAEEEDAQVSVPQTLNYVINNESNTVLVDCADYINKPHSADDTDSYYYFVIALNKSLHKNANVVTFREKHIHIDDESIFGYSENTESLDQSIRGWGTDDTEHTKTTKFTNGVAKESFKNGHKSVTKSVVFKASVNENIKVSSEQPFVSDAINSSNKTVLAVDEYDIAAIEIPGYYLNDTGEVVYGVSYNIFVSTDGNNYTEFKNGTITEDVTVTLDDGINYAYVTYTPSDKTKSIDFYTYGMGSYSYGVSPKFVYEFTVSDETFAQMESGTIKYAGIVSNAADENGNTGKMTNYITIEELHKEYKIAGKDATAKLVKNHYEITNEYAIDFFTNSADTKYSKFNIVTILPDNYYGNSTGSLDDVIAKIKDTISFSETVSDTSSPLVITKISAGSEEETITLTPENIKEYVTISGRTTDEGNAIIAFAIDFGEYTIAVPENDRCITFSYTWLMSRLNQEEFGKKKVFDTITAMEVKDAQTATPASDFPLMPGDNYFPNLDDGSFVTAVSSVSVKSTVATDINGNNETKETLYFTKTNISVTDTGETAQATTVEVSTEYTPLSTTTYSNPAVTRSNKEYTLAFSFDGYGTEYTKLIYVSNLGNAEEDASDWYGTLKSVEDAICVSDAELTTEIFYKAKTVNLKDALSSFKGTNDITIDNSWTAAKDYAGDLSDVKSIAVVVTGEIPSDETIKLNVKMQSNTDEQYDNLYNTANFAVLTLSSEGTMISEAYSESVVIQQINPQITYVKRIKAADVNLANGTPTFIVEIKSTNENISFPIVFNEYKTVTIDSVQYYEIEVDLSDRISFGTYTLSELSSLRYGKPTLSLSEGQGSVSDNSTVAFTTTSEYSEAKIISVSEKIKHNNLSHNAICVNSFNNPVE